MSIFDTPLPPEPSGQPPFDCIPVSELMQAQIAGGIAALLLVATISPFARHEYRQSFELMDARPCYTTTGWMIYVTFVRSGQRYKLAEYLDMEYFMLSVEEGLENRMEKYVTEVIYKLTHDRPTYPTV